MCNDGCKCILGRICAIGDTQMFKQNRKVLLARLIYLIG
ncbi:hypothetical protein XaFJ1_GM001832 [Xanthomonas albilineans]|nr:hypothetical protein XaFJ1_GM001832 [Xanthomonas albilineans]